MANLCEYNLRVVAKGDDKSLIERFISIMQNKDSEYHVYRCFSADVDGEIKSADGGMLYATVYGDVAWSCAEWFNSSERVDDVSPSGSHYITVDFLCRKLGVAVECWASEGGCGFQEHYIVEHDGSIVENDRRSWTDTDLCDYDDDGDDDDGDDDGLDESDNGFGDEYLEWNTVSDIWGEDD